MAKGRVRGDPVYYFNECPHRDGDTTFCVCLKLSSRVDEYNFVHKCIFSCVN